MTQEPQGLSRAEVKERLSQFGPNTLPETPAPSWLSLLFQQLKSPLVYVLIFAVVVSFAFAHLTDALIILLAVVINTLFGFIQEKRASDALVALKHLLSAKATVIREGKRFVVDTSDLVPGDAVVLSAGTKVPADGKLVLANRLFADEAILTGESMSVRKAEEEEAFMGTTIMAGQGILIVNKTGEETKFGRIASEVQKPEADTPLQRQLRIFSSKLVVVVVVLTVLVFFFGLWRGEAVMEMFSTSVALAVSSIPEGLLVSLTVVLAIGMQRILKRQGLVRRLSSAETLGGVTVICVDKTGTLTLGKMEVVEYVGYKEDLAAQMLVANDLDDPIVIAGNTWAKTVLPGETPKFTRLDSIPFSPEERLSLYLNHTTEGNTLYVNGAPDILLARTNLNPRERAEILSQLDDMAKRGERLLGLAKKKISGVKKTLDQRDAAKDLEWVGMLAFFDPVRSGVEDAFGLTQAAGIQTIVISGDYADTAKFVMTQIGHPVSENEILVGSAVEQLSASQLASKVKNIRLFARTTPDQKMKIVEALKSNGEVVAMMGDGVNDAPALHKADIGIVVEDATDVAKESADLILLDSNFSTIVAAVSEGRGIFENIRKIILYLLCDAFEEILVVVGSIIFGLPLPITAAQILWINLVSDGLPNLALTVDPHRPGIMGEKPRPKREQLFVPWMYVLIGSISLFSGVTAFMLFSFIWKSTGDLSLARSMAFATLGVNSLIYVFSVRTLTTPFWKNHIFGNSWLIGAVVVGMALQVLPFVWRPLQGFFGTVFLSPAHWTVVFGLALLMFLFVEVFKLVFHLKVLWSKRMEWKAPYR